MFGLELHPAVVHFPIALTTVGAAASIAYLFVRREWLRWFAPILLSLALLGGVAGYFTGQSAEDRAEKIGVPESAIEQHEETSLYGAGILALATLLSWATHARRRGMWLAAVAAVAATCVLLWAGHLGGRLVYVHGAGRVTEAPSDGRLAPAEPK